MNKFFLKLFNKNKYQKLKYELQEIKNYEHYKKKINPELEKISESIKTKKHLTFIHSGHLGDIINSLPLIKEISINSKCDLYLEINKKIPKEITNGGHPFGR